MKKTNKKVVKKIAKSKKGISAGKVAVIGTGVAAVGAGVYYLLGPKGKEHQKKAKDLMLKMKTEIKKDLKKAKSVTKPLYHSAVDALAKTYGKKYKNHSDEIVAIAQKLKNEWKNI